MRPFIHIRTDRRLRTCRESSPKNREGRLRPLPDPSAEPRRSADGEPNLKQSVRKTPSGISFAPAGRRTEGSKPIRFDCCYNSPYNCGASRRLVRPGSATRHSLLSLFFFSSFYRRTYFHHPLSSTCRGIIPFPEAVCRFPDAGRESDCAPSPSGPHARQLRQAGGLLLNLEHFL